MWRSSRTAVWAITRARASHGSGSRHRSTARQKKLGQRSPANKPCIFDRDGRLARLWVEPYTDDPDGAPLGDVLAILQRSARGRAFQVWAYLALSGDFTILVLCRGRARADELERWLARAPLVGQAGPETVEVPVSTAAIQ